MHRRIFYCGISIVLSFYVSVIYAVQPPDEASAPTQQPFIDMLSGNSNKGDWTGIAYLQFFAKDGTTRYQEEGRRPASGTWRVNTQGQYCSIWPPSATETCYDVLISGDKIYWKSADVYYEATLIKGNIFNP